MVKIDFKEFNIRESPFHEEYGGKREHIKVRIPIDKRQLLENHFNSAYGKGGMTIGIEKIIDEYIDRLCLKKGIFNHLEAVMLIPKSDNIDEIECLSQIIAVINTKSDFNKNFYHNEGFRDDMNGIFELKTFNESNFNYEMEMFKNTIDSCVFHTSKEELKSFESFKQKQAELYPDLDIDDCYFIRFPLNNYIDNVNHGKSFHYKSWKNNHLGGYIMADSMSDVMNFLLIDWYYLSEISSQIRVDFQFVPEDYFVQMIMDSYYSDNVDNEDVYDAFAPYLDGNYRKNHLKQIRDELILKLALVDKALKDDD